MITFTSFLGKYIIFFRYHKKYLKGTEKKVPFFCVCLFFKPSLMVNCINSMFIILVVRHFFLVYKILGKANHIIII